MEPASIRTKNPGAMWGRTGPRPSSDKTVATNAVLPLKWGSKETIYLSDGTGQGNNIAVFPTYVQGICAQLDLWRSSKHYKNKAFKDAIRTWSGGNNVEDYIAFVLKRVPGMKRDTIMDDAFWRSKMGLAFLKAQAWHEAGKPYPAPDADWLEAQRRVMGGPKPKDGAGTAGGVIIATGGAAVEAKRQGFDWGDIAVIAMFGLVLAVVGYFAVRRYKQRKQP